MARTKQPFECQSNNPSPLRSDLQRPASLACAVATAVLAACGSGSSTDSSMPPAAVSRAAQTHAASAALNAQAAPVTPAAAGVPAQPASTAGVGRTVVVKASGTPANGGAPLMSVLVDGKLLQPGSVDVGNKPADYRFTSDTDIPVGAVVTVRFENDAMWTNPATGEVQDRNLFVDSIKVGDRLTPATSPEVVLLREELGGLYRGALRATAGQRGLY